MKESKTETTIKALRDLAWKLKMLNQTDFNTLFAAMDCLEELDFEVRRLTVQLTQNKLPIPEVPCQP